MKKLSKVLTVFLVFSLVLLVVKPIFTEAATVKLNKKKVTLEVGDKLTLKLTTAKTADVKWKSSNKKVATVTSKGVVKAKEEGKAKITATYKKKKYVCNITVVKKEADNLNTEEKNAVRKAEQYLKFMAFSKTGLIDQLEYEGFSTEAATKAVDSMNINWNKQAVLKAEQYIKLMPFSSSELIGQLEYEGFSNKQATEAVDSLDVDWDEQAKLKVQDYLDLMAFSRSGLIDQLEYNGFDEKTAAAAVDSINVDWNEQAKLKAQEYLDLMAFSKSGLIDQLEYSGFTKEQAEYAVAAVGY